MSALFHWRRFMFHSSTVRRLVAVVGRYLNIPFIGIVHFSLFVRGATSMKECADSQNYYIIHCGLVLKRDKKGSLLVEKLKMYDNLVIQMCHSLYKRSHLGKIGIFELCISQVRTWDLCILENDLNDFCLSWIRYFFHAAKRRQVITCWLILVKIRWLVEQADLLRSL